MIQVFKPMKWVYTSWKNDFTGDSATTSHMTSDPTGSYHLQKNLGSVMIGNGQNFRCTHKGLLDAICVQNDRCTARETWEIKFAPQLNHDRFSISYLTGWSLQDHLDCLQ